MLDEMDPFRDGRAAERMGTYIQWLLEGFHRGDDRERVMAQAAERYAARWGRDKIAHVGDHGLRTSGITRALKDAAPIGALQPS